MGIGESYGNQRVARRCYITSIRSSETLKRAGEQSTVEHKKIKLERRKGKEPRVMEFEDGEIVSIELRLEQPGHSVRMGWQLSKEEKESMIGVLREKTDIFAWKPKDMKGIDPEIAVPGSISNLTRS